jgi:hypothetical protein
VTAVRNAALAQAALLEPSEPALNEFATIFGAEFKGEAAVRRAALNADAEFRRDNISPLIGDLRRDLAAMTDIKQRMHASDIDTTRVTREIAGIQKHIELLLSRGNSNESKFTEIRDPLPPARVARVSRRGTVAEENARAAKEFEEATYYRHKARLMDEAHERADNISRLLSSTTASPSKTQLVALKLSQEEMNNMHPANMDALIKDYETYLERNPTAPITSALAKQRDQLLLHALTSDQKVSNQSSSYVYNKYKVEPIGVLESQIRSTEQSIVDIGDLKAGVLPHYVKRGQTLLEALKESRIAQLAVKRTYIDKCKAKLESTRTLVTQLEQRIGQYAE